MALKTKTKGKKAATRAPRVTTNRVHFAIRAIRNANPRNLRPSRTSRVLARFFSL